MQVKPTVASACNRWSRVKWPFTAWEKKKKRCFADGRCKKRKRVLIGKLYDCSRRIVLCLTVTQLTANNEKWHQRSCVWNSSSQTSVGLIACESNWTWKMKDESKIVGISTWFHVCKVENGTNRVRAANAFVWFNKGNVITTATNWTPQSGRSAEIVNPKQICQVSWTS